MLAMSSQAARLSGYFRGFVVILYARETRNNIGLGQSGRFAAVLDLWLLENVRVHTRPVEP